MRSRVAVAALLATAAIGGCGNGDDEPEAVCVSSGCSSGTAVSFDGKLTKIWPAAKTVRLCVVELDTCSRPHFGGTVAVALFSKKMRTLDNATLRLIVRSETRVLADRRKTFPVDEVKKCEQTCFFANTKLTQAKGRIVWQRRR